MASNVSNAVGTQRQFTAQPQNVYEKRLAQVNGHVAVEAANNTDGLRLAQSLGVLSDSLDAQLESKEKNMEKIGVADAERVAAGLTEEDWKTRDALTLLNKYGKFQTADNPYAVALIEKMRGKYFSAKFDGDYQLWRRDQKEPKNSSEEAGMYQKYMHDKFGEVSGISTNQDAFNQGYFDNFMPQTVGHVNSFIKNKSADLDTQRVAGTAADLGNVTLNYHTMTKEQKTQTVNDIIAKAYVAHASDGEVVQQVDKFITEYAERTGDVDFLGHAWNNIMVGTDDKGQPRKLGNTVDMAHAVKVAEAAKRIRNDKDVFDTTEKLSKMSVPDIYKTMEAMEKDPNQNHMYQTVAPMIDDIIRQRKTEEAKAKVKAFNNMNKTAAESAVSKIITSHIGLYLNGRTTDARNKPVANSIADFKGKVQWTDDKGTEHNVEVTPAMVNDAILNELDYISQNSSDEGEAAARSLKLLKWGAAKDYAQSFAQTLSNELGTLTADKLNPNGDLSGNLKSAMVMYHSSRESFKDIFGNDAAKQLGVLNLLQGGTGSMATAANLYAQSRDNRNVPDMVKKVEGEIRQALPITTMDGFQTIDGGTSTVDMNPDTMLGTNWDMHERVRETAETLMYTGGYTKDQAITAAKKYAQDNYATYRGTAIPKGIFEDLDVYDKLSNGKEILDDTVAMFKGEHPELADESVWVDYDEERGIFSVNGGGHRPMPFSKQELVKYGNKKAASWGAGHKDGAWTADEINAERDQDAPPELPQGSYWGV